MKSNTRVLRAAQVADKVNLKPTRIYELERVGKFPRRFKIAGGRAAGWLESEIDAFIARNAEKRSVLKAP